MADRPSKRQRREERRSDEIRHRSGNPSQEDMESNLQGGQFTADQIAVVRRAVEFLPMLPTLVMSMQAVQGELADVKSNAKKDALVWGETELSFVTAELLQQAYKSKFKPTEARKHTPENKFENRKQESVMKELAKRMGYENAVGTVAYMADVVITKRNARAHLDDPDNQLAQLVGGVSRGRSRSEIRDDKIQKCLDLCERYPQLADEKHCRYEFEFLKNKHHIYELFELEIEHD